VTRGVDLAGRTVGPGAPCYVIAEAGVNHNGDTALAHRLVDVAAAAGADAIKFQAFDPEAVVSYGAAAAPYQERRGATSQLELLKALTLPTVAWPDLTSHAHDAGLQFLCTAFDLASLDVVASLDVPAFKVPSGEIDNLPFLHELASRGRPLLISTGTATLDEVAVAVDATRSAPAICLLHCVTSYPAPVEASNLRAIVSMRDHFDVPVGWSDHTLGAVSAIAAVALGAAVLEKHITVDRGLPGPDHAASADPAEFAEYTRSVRAAEAAVGDGVKRPTADEVDNIVHVRRSLHAARDLRPGERLAADAVALLRPATGLPPSTDVAGLVVVRDVPAGAPIMPDDVAGTER
jgi:N-acetylneuraminate synthase/N,N'-diacetyllegionaminate synthase